MINLFYSESSRSCATPKKISDKRLEADCLFNIGIIFTESLQISKAVVAYTNASSLYNDMQLHQKAEICNRQINILNIFKSKE